MISARELLPLLPDDVEAALRLAGGTPTGLVLVLRFDGEVLARLELHRPIPDVPDWLWSSLVRDRALARLRDRRGEVLADILLDGARTRPSRDELRGELAGTSIEATEAVLELAAAIDTSRNHVRRGEIRAVLSETAAELDLPLAEVSHPADDGARHGLNGALWLWLPPAAGEGGAR